MVRAMDTYGQRLRKARKHSKLSQDDLATMLGITQGGDIPS